MRDLTKSPLLKYKLASDTDTDGKLLVEGTCCLGLSSF